jgi:CubicO group peptidase (beta-lactamase class C family)
LEHGLVQLSDPISKYVPQTPKDRETITLSQLLVHQSGLPQNRVAEGVVDRSDALARILEQPLECRPGTVFSYSDDNYQTAAAIVEIVAGQKFEEFVTGELLSPAGLSDTGFAATQQAKDVVPVKKALPHRLRIRQWGEIGTGGMFSTTHDLWLWYEALRSGKILTPTSVELTFSPYVEMQEGWSGLGWFTSITRHGNAVVFTRGNDDIGANSLIYAYPDRHFVIVALTHAGDKDNDTSWSLSVLRTVEEILCL